jgi:GTP-binding protein HflX
VVDVSHPSFEDHIRAVNDTLRELGALDKQTIMVFNKIDAYQPVQTHSEDELHTMTLDDFKHSWMAKNNNPAIFISATERENIDEFRSLIYELVKDIHTKRYPYDNLLY